MQRVIHMFQGEGEAEFCNMITVNKSWMCHYNPESNQQSSQWMLLCAEEGNHAPEPAQNFTDRNFHLF